MSFFTKFFNLHQVTTKIAIRRIAKILGAPARPGYDFLNQPERSWEPMEKAENELFKICQAQDDLHNILQEYHANDETLKTIYEKLILLGAGQWCGSRYVPVAALTTPQTLEYLLRTIATSQGRNEVEKEMAFTVIMYFSGDVELPLKYNKYTDASTLKKQ